MSRLALKVLGCACLLAWGNYYFDFDPVVTTAPGGPAAGGALYDMQTMKAPVTSGTVMRVLAKLLSLWPLSSLLKIYLYRDAGFPLVRSFVASSLPDYRMTHLPLKFVSSSAPLLSENEMLRKASELLQLLGQSLPEHTNTGGGGFHFPSVEDYAKYYQAGGDPLKVMQKLVDIIQQAETRSLNAILSANTTEIFAQARNSAARHQNRQPLSVFDGVPILIKNEMDVRPYITTVGTTILKQNKATEQDAAVVARLRKQGAIIVGVTAMHEYGAGVTGHNSHTGPARNPYHLSHAAGGSSGGSAAAVAAGIVPVAIGADGGGSVRIPAAFTGVYGLKPTFGRISSKGSHPICWSVGHVGPLTANMRDLALSYAAIAGPDKEDGNTWHQPPITLPKLNQEGLSSLRGKKIGVFSPYFHDATPDIVKASHEALKQLEKNYGMEIVEVTLPNLNILKLAHTITIISEMSASLDPYWSRAHELGLELQLNFLVSKLMSATDYVAAQRARTYFINVTAQLFAPKEEGGSGIDFLATPTTGVTSPLINEDALPDGESNLPQLSHIMRFIYLGNFAGIPAITLPVGYDEGGLPIGLQLYADWWREDLLLLAGYGHEELWHAHRRKPKVWLSAFTG
eukprot:gb/GEZN01004567.1/.p1 GENE.gb/GEZN01004567.1/~~gb/GEZN01004567.1/.p1  ORF type:complete len:627 (+),score=63.82 gb/GEZN01004567.1/:29-1909(+)